MKKYNINLKRVLEETLILFFSAVMSVALILVPIRILEKFFGNYSILWLLIPFLILLVIMIWKTAQEEMGKKNNG